MEKEDLKKIHEMFTKCGPLFITLGDEVRQNLLLNILDAGEEGINVMDLTAKTNLSRPNISHHLKILKASGYVQSEKKGTWVYYKASVADNFAEIDKLIHETLKIIEEAQAKLKDSN